jgi:hypothetical protein
MVGELDDLEDVGARRTGLDEGTRLDLPGLRHRHLEQPLALFGTQRPCFPTQASDPDPIMIEGPEAVGDQSAEGILVDVLAPRATERCIQ